MYQTGYGLRSLFVIILTQCNVTDPLKLWNDHKKNLAEDILYKHRIKKRNPKLNYTEDIFQYALIDVEKRLKIFHKSLEHFKLPKITITHPEFNEMALHNYNQEYCKAFVANCKPNEEQKKIL